MSDGYFTFSRVTEGLRLGLLVPGVAGPGRGGSKCLGGAAGARPERKRWRSALTGTLTLRQTRHTAHGTRHTDTWRLMIDRAGVQSAVSPELSDPGESGDCEH